VRGWLLANVFLMLIVAIGAFFTFVAFTLVRLLRLPLSAEPYAFFLAGCVALVLTFIAVKDLHHYIDRRWK
jgi:hypothetical protein